MSKFSKQFAIIEKIKSIVGGKKKVSISDDASISKDMASKIQHSSYNISKCKIKKETYTDPYLVIAEQLNVEDLQIFRTAVYNLARIAINDKAKRKDIVSIFERTKKDNLSNKDRAEYLSQKILDIKSVK